jgi:FkbM family methyltransferase
MSTQRIRYNPPLTTSLTSLDCFKEEPFFLVDIGASGGIEPHWNTFIPYLRAVGFDPLVAEIERLKGLSSSPMIQYEAAFVGCKNYEEKLLDHQFNSITSRPMQRSSAIRAMNFCKYNYIRSVYNQGEDVKYTDNFVELDNFFNEEEKDRINFLKIDTDGSDFQVLLGAETLLSRGNLLGLSLEATFHKKDNLFSQIDPLLRKYGFSLFDLDVYRYSRGDLPKPFVYNIPAQTIDGQVIWGEAVYFRDYGDKSYEEKWSLQTTKTNLLKLACLYEIFGLEDCSAELLIKYRNEFKETIDIKQALNQLVPQVQGQEITFGQYNNEFEKYIQNTFINKEVQTKPAIGIKFQAQSTLSEQQRFQAALEQAHAQLQQTQHQLEQSRAQTERLETQLEDSRSQVQVTQAKLQQLQTQQEHSHSQLQDTQAQVVQLQKVIRAMENTSFWKLRTAWLRLKQTLGLTRGH